MDPIRSDVLSTMHQSMRNQTRPLVARPTGPAGLIVGVSR
jgi:hypothetical protein